MVLLGQMESVIADQDDNGVIPVWTFLQRLQYTAHLRIGIGRCGKIGPNRLLVQTVFKDGSNKIALAFRYLAGQRRHVIQVVFQPGRRGDFIQRKHVEIFLRHIPGHMRIEQAAGDEERFVVFFLQLFDRCIGTRCIVHILFREMNRPPVLLSSSDRRERGARRSRIALMSPALIPRLAFRFPAMPDLSVPGGVVTRFSEQLRKGDGLLKRTAFLRGHAVLIQTRFPGADSRQESRPGRRTERAGCVGAVKQNPAVGHFADIRNHDLPRIPVGVAQQPCIEVINGQEQHVHALRRGFSQHRKNQCHQNKPSSQHFHIRLSLFI